MSGTMLGVGEEPNRVPNLQSLTDKESSNKGSYSSVDEHGPASYPAPSNPGSTLILGPAPLSDRSHSEMIGSYGLSSLLFQRAPETICLKKEDNHRDLSLPCGSQYIWFYNLRRSQGYLKITKAWGQSSYLFFV